MADLLLGIDVGTSSSKAALARPDGTVLATASIPHTTSQPRPGWFEHDPEAIWWGETAALCHQVVAEAGCAGSDVAAMAVSAIGPCLLPLDREGQPLRDGILYGIDTRASTEVDELAGRIPPDVLDARSGMEFSSQAVGPKIAWLSTHEPDVWSATETLTSATSYIVYRLTGRHVIDRHTGAHFMPFMDIDTLEWTSDFDDMVSGRTALPELAWATETAGALTPAAAAATGLTAGIPVAVGTVDAAAEGLGVGVAEPGDLMVMYGSTMFFILVTDTARRVPGAWLVGGLDRGYHIAAGMATSGLLTDWLRDLLRPDASPEDGFAELFAAASSVPPGSEGLLMLPYFAGERTPINDPHASGAAIGLGLHHGPGHLMRATLEAIAHGARHNIETIEAAGATVRRVVAVGGGTQSDLWMKIVSDVTGRTQVIPEQRVGAAYGNAFLAGVSTGRLAPSDLRHWARPERVIEPDPEAAEIYADNARRYEQLHIATRDLQHQMTAMRSG